MCDSDSTISYVESVEDIQQHVYNDDYNSDSTIIETDPESIANKHNIHIPITNTNTPAAALSVNPELPLNDVENSKKSNFVDDNLVTYNSADEDLRLVDLLIKKYSSPIETLTISTYNDSNKPSTSKDEPIEISSDEGDDLPNFSLKSFKPSPMDYSKIDRDTIELYTSTNYFKSIPPIQMPSSESVLLKDSNSFPNSSSLTDLVSLLNNQDLYSVDNTTNNKNLFKYKSDNENSREKIANATDDKPEKKSATRKRKLNDDKENRKLARAEERAKKQEEAEYAKTLKQALRIANKNMKPDECIKFITVTLDTEIMTEKYGGEILNALQNAEITYKLQSQLIPFTITWNRKVQSHHIDENNKLILTSDVTETDETVLIMNWNQIVEMVHDRSLLPHIQSIKSTIISKKLFLVIYGLQNYFKYRKNKKQQEVRSEISQSSQKTNKQDRIFGNVPSISKNQLEFALTELQILCSCCHRLIENPQDLGTMIVQFTKSIAQTPYKLEKQQNLESEWYICGDNKDCVQVDKNGNGLQRLWQQQLTAFPLARLEHAEAIMEKYSTPSALMAEYDHCTKMQSEKLLQDIQIRRTAGLLTNVRKIGPELSKKIYTFFTSTNSDVIL